MLPVGLGGFHVSDHYLMDLVSSLLPVQCHFQSDFTLMIDSTRISDSLDSDGDRLNQRIPEVLDFSVWLFWTEASS